MYRLIQGRVGWRAIRVLRNSNIKDSRIRIFFGSDNSKFTKTKIKNRKKKRKSWKKRDRRKWDGNEVMKVIFLNKFSKKKSVFQRLQGSSESDDRLVFIRRRPSKRTSSVFFFGSW
ncbi:hypothetical protein B9Z55_000341 [Caenorhabditis nigoni]|uniref:Uncharacterized protein n=1 Tax=Caenorhabditis nigoni TaxID=1611254 RepID=A0A2G5VQI2_9PELO|nr:hypothetical protein B9Z55_000341 [Caenorhabditis nigoni]